MPSIQLTRKWTLPCANRITHTWIFPVPQTIRPENIGVYWISAYNHVDDIVIWSCRHMHDIHIQHEKLLCKPKIYCCLPGLCEAFHDAIRVKNHADLHNHQAILRDWKGDSYNVAAELTIASSLFFFLLLQCLSQGMKTFSSHTMPVCAMLQLVIIIFTRSPCMLLSKCK